MPLRAREGLETGEFEGTKIAAHSIKGSAAVFGATELSEAAKVLEHAVKVRAGAGNAIFTQKQSSDHHLVLLFRFRSEQNGDTDRKELGKMADTIETCFKAVVSPSQRDSSLSSIVGC